MKNIVVLLLLMVSTNVFAEWSRVNTAANGAITVYVDYETIKRKGNKAEMLSLLNFKTALKYNNDRYLSVTSRVEYNCEEKTDLALDFSFYSGNMKTGDVVFSTTIKDVKDETGETDEDETKSISISPGTINETLFKIACDKR